MPWRCAESEDYIEDFVELWWCSTNVMLADNLTKVATPSRNDLIRICTDNSICIGKDFMRPRPTQRAHSFGVLENQKREQTIGTRQGKRKIEFTNWRTHTYVKTLTVMDV